MRRVQLVTDASILGLGQSPSAFGTTLALILTFIVILGGVANVLIGYIVVQVMNERRQNRERMRSKSE
jgi:membrane protein YqaA with SNARE-associated domain